MVSSVTWKELWKGRIRHGWAATSWPELPWELTYPLPSIWSNYSDLTNGVLVREIPLFQRNLGWWIIIIWPDQLFLVPLLGGRWYIIANWVIICYLPPIKGARKLHWYQPALLSRWCSSSERYVSFLEGICCIEGIGDFTQLHSDYNRTIIGQNNAPYIPTSTKGWHQGFSKALYFPPEMLEFL